MTRVLAALVVAAVLLVGCQEQKKPDLYRFELEVRGWVLDRDWDYKWCLVKEESNWEWMNKAPREQMSQAESNAMGVFCMEKADRLNPFPTLTWY